MALPPGPLYVLGALPKVLAPPIAVVALSRVVSYGWNIDVPAWAIVLGCLLSLPTAFVLSVQWLAYSDRRNAGALGAEMAPIVEYKLPGGVDLLSAMRKDNEARFPGTFLYVCEPLVSHLGCSGFRISEWTAKYGAVCIFRVYFENRVRVMSMPYR